MVFQFIQELLQFQRLQRGFDGSDEIDEIVTVEANGPGLIDR